MRTFDEHKDRIEKKAAKIRRKRAVIASTASALVLVLVLGLFMPLPNSAPDVSAHQNSPYYHLISWFNQVTYKPPVYKNNYEKIAALLKNAANVLVPNKAPSGVQVEGATPPGNYGGITQVSEPEQQYQEVTDNQVEGVIEADIFKRSDKYIYHLQKNILTVYSIDKADSKQVGSFEIEELKPDVYKPSVYYSAEMYLSQDCSSVFVIAQTLGMGPQETRVYTLDVSNPAKIKQVNEVCFPGNYESSRMVDGNILLSYEYWVHTEDIDYEKPETFVPVYGEPDNLCPMIPDDIYCPVDSATYARYTVLALLDGKTSKVLDIQALLSVDAPLLVSEDTVYVARRYQDAQNGEKNYVTTNMTEITGVGYKGGKLEILGSIKLEGSIRDQYSMDQHNGILRVATSTRVNTRDKDPNDADIFWLGIGKSKSNCNLYCIDLKKWEIAASVCGFAPDGDEVKSARFEGDTAFICTAEVVYFTDPVYFFDLSDLNNITYKHTPIIAGFSTSLIHFGDNLIGIGYDDNRTLKIEAYVETADGVESVATFTRKALFSEKYKSYFIDRKQQLIGLAVRDFTDQVSYLLLQFNGEDFTVLKEIPLEGWIYSDARAFMEDGWLYVLSTGLTVEQVFE